MMLSTWTKYIIFPIYFYVKKVFLSDFTKVLKQKRGLNKLGFFPCYFDEYKGFYLLLRG